MEYREAGSSVERIRRQIGRENIRAAAYPDSRWISILELGHHPEGVPSVGLVHQYANAHAIISNDQTPDIFLPNNRLERY